MNSRGDLYRDVLQEIVERIPLHKDILRYAAVCKQWRSIVMENLHRLPQKLPLRYCFPRQHPLPLLMQCNDEEVSGKIEFVSVLDDKSFTDLSVPEIGGNWIAGSCNGWLVLVEILGRKINLLNPLTRAQIPLPSSSSFEHPLGSFENEYDDFAFIQKALVISEPNVRNLEGCVVIAIISCLKVLSYCRPGDDKWRNIKGSPIEVDDVISYKGQLYAITAWGTLISFDVEHQSIMSVAGHAGIEREDGKRYLVESISGDLLLVVRVDDDDGDDNDDDETYSTLYFSAYKLEEVDETQSGVVRANYPTRMGGKLVEQAVNYQWVELQCLGDQILFLGRSYSKSVPASLYPDLKGNCIYFTDDDPDYRHVCVTRGKAGVEDFEEYKEEKYDMGVYDMEEKIIQPIGLMDDGLFRLPPVWLEPNPW